MENYNSLSRKPWRFECRNDNTAELFLYSEIGSDGMGSGTTAAAFVSDLKALGPVDQITVRINSPGGAVSDGLAIFNSLVQHAARIVTKIDAMAASISGVIAMAGDRVLMASNGLLMVHDPTVSVYGGDASELRRMAGVLDKARDSIVAAYRRHVKMSSAEVARLMASETWMDSREALAMGFVDEVLNEQGDFASVAAKADLSKFHNLPASLIAARVRKVDPDPAPAYVSIFPRSIEELDASVERMRLRMRLEKLRH